MCASSHLILVEPLTANLMNFYSIFLWKTHFRLWGKLSLLSNLYWLVQYNCTLHAFRIFQFFSILYDLTCRVLASIELRDVPHNLDPLLSFTPAVGSKRSSAPNVTPLRTPKRHRICVQAPLCSQSKSVWVMIIFIEIAIFFSVLKFVCYSPLDLALQLPL